MIQFVRRQLGQPFLNDILARTSTGQSSVLIGPCYSGKSRLLTQLVPALQKDSRSILIYRSAARSPDIQHQVWLGGERKEMVGDTGRLIDELSQTHSKPITLLLATADNLGQHSSRHLLSRIRARIEARSAVVVLTSESHLKDFLDGPNSEFDCAVHFVVQNWDRPSFGLYLHRYCRALNIRWTSTEKAAEVLYSLAGGSIYLLRMILRLAVDVRIAEDAESEDPFDPDVLAARYVGSLLTPEGYWKNVFRHSTQLVASDPTCWGQLEALITSRDPVPISPVSGPTTLELSGLAVLDGSKLEIPSQIVVRFVEDYYNSRRFGDLYAQNGRWSLALERYRLTEHEGRRRPDSPDDVTVIQSLVQALVAAMHAGENRQAIEELFSLGCQYLLGFPEVTVWSRRGDWEIESDATDVMPASLLQCRKVLNLVTEVPGLAEIHIPEGRVSTAVVLSSYLSRCARCVIVSDFAAGAEMSRHRESLMKLLAMEFSKAHVRAVDAEGNRARLEQRDQHIHILTRIYSRLGAGLLETEQVLRLTAGELRKLGYKRVLFSFVDPERTRIRGVWDDPGAPVNLAALTDYLLAAPDADVQPWVVHYKQPRIIREAAQEVLCNPLAVAGAKLHAMAVVPVFDDCDDVVGTIHIERDDGTVPSELEVADLVLFGRMLSGLLAQSRRTTLICQALDKIPEPLFISDRQLRAKFANQPGCALFPELLDGWQSMPRHLIGPGAVEMTACFETSIHAEREIIRRHGVGNDKTLIGDILCARVGDVGGVVHINDQTFLRGVFDGIDTVTQAGQKAEVASLALDAASGLGFEKCRYYEKDPARPDRLVSKEARGLSPEHLQAFREGAVEVTPDIEDGWQCILKGGPCVFYWDPDAPPDHLAHRNEWGLVAQIVRTEKYSEILEKTPGTVRTDLPLGNEQDLFGKVTLERQRALKPEELLLLDILVKQVSRTLQAISRRDEVSRLRGLQEGTERALGMMAHQFRNELTPLDTRLTRYRLEAEAMPQKGQRLEEINVAFRSDLERLHSIIDRMPQFLGPIRLEYEEFDLLAELQLRLRNMFPDCRHYTLQHTAATVRVHGDRLHLTSVFNELIDNTKQMWAGCGELWIGVTVSELSTVDGNVIQIVYEDNGPGVPEEILHRIFDVTYSYRPGKDPGTGIGLYYAKRVLTAHGGQIWVEPSRGARFVLQFPQVHLSGRE